MVLDDRVAAGETVLLAQPVIHALGGMALLAVGLTIPIQPRVDDLCEPVQLGTLDWHRAPETRRHRECHGLVDCVARNVEMTRRCALAHAVGAGQTNLPVKFHGINLQALHATARRANWPVFTPPAAGLSHRYRGRLLHRRSHRTLITFGRGTGAAGKPGPKTKNCTSFIAGAKLSPTRHIPHTSIASCERLPSPEMLYCGSTPTWQAPRAVFLLAGVCSSNPRAFFSKLVKGQQAPRGLARRDLKNFSARGQSCKTGSCTRIALLCLSRIRYRNPRQP
jgi:hypothetical protein